MKEQAQTLSLDIPKFDACLVSGEFKPLIDRDLQLGGMAGVSGTPAFYINGILLTGAQPASAFESLIESELANAAAKKNSNNRASSR